MKGLGLFDATAIVVGSMIGSGIFFSPSIMAQWVQTPGILLGLWVLRRRRRTAPSGAGVGGGGDADRDSHEP